MDTPEIILLVVVLLVIAAVVAALVARSRRRTQLKSTFGPEYDRTVESSDRRRDAERDLAEREQRRKSLDIRPLPAAERHAFSERWRTTQTDFVDHPEMAVRQADLLVAEVMGRRGYPVGDFEQMSRDVSVDHADVVHEYRAAHEISELNERKQASTEQLRQAMVHYRALFTDLLSDSDDGDRDDTGHRGGATTGTSTHAPSDLHASTDSRHDEHRDASASRHDARSDERPTDRPADDGSGRTDDAAYASDEDRDRRRTSGTDRIDTSRADGVPVERGGIMRDREDEDGRDRPRG